jgi:hypothetical protein
MPLVFLFKTIITNTLYCFSKGVIVVELNHKLEYDSILILDINMWHCQ